MYRRTPSTLGHRDAALVVGSLALYALIPAAVIWLIIAVALRLRSRHGSSRWFTLVFASAALNWWVPYLLGTYPGEIDPQTFEREYSANLSLLPTVAGHPVVPDVQHTLIHSLVLASAMLSARVAFGRRPAPAVR